MSGKLDARFGEYDAPFFDKIDGVWWGLAFILGALVLGAENVGWFESTGWWNTGGVFFTGAGILALICAIIRLRLPAYRSKWAFSTIFGVIFLAIGLGAWQVGWWIWALALLGIGGVTLLSAFSRST